MFVLINSWQLSFFGKVTTESVRLRLARSRCDLTRNWVMDKTHNKKIRNLSFEKKNSKIWHVGYLRHIKKVSMCFVLHVYISCFTYSFISNACGRWTFMNDFQKEKNPFQIKCSNFNSVEFLGAERMPAQALESLFYSLLHICFYILFIDSFSFMFCVFNV